MKKIEKFMICSNIFAPGDYRSVYKIEPDFSIRLQEFRPVLSLFPPSDLAVILPLPREIVYMIIDRLILKYIKQSNFELAAQLIFFNKATTMRFYYRHFEHDYYLPIRLMIARLSRTFHLMQNVLDGVTQFPNEEHDHYIALDIPFKGKYKNGMAFNPWNFNGMLNLIQIPRPGIYGIEDFRGFVTGPYVTDIVWMNGRSERGITASTFFRLPVIVFVFTDQDENIIPERKAMENHKGFQTVTKFLKMAFGPTTGVFFAVQGHFIFDDQVLVEL